MGRPVKKLNNAGISLMEIVVSLLMVGFISTMLVMFVSISQNSYRMVKTESTLQDEAAFAMGYIGKVAIEACEVGCTEEDEEPAGYDGAFYFKAIDTMQQELANRSDDLFYHIFWLDEDVLYYIKVAEDGGIYLNDSDNWLNTVGGRTVLNFGNTLSALKSKGYIGTEAKDARHVLAKCVKGFSVKNEASLIVVTLDLELMGEQYKAEKVVTARNYTR